MKGTIQENHIPVNHWMYIVAGLPPLVITEQSGIEDELETTDLPDRTRASGGNRKASEFEISIPMHHIVEQAAMESWFLEEQDPVSPTYKKAGTLIHFGLNGVPARTFGTVGVFPTKRALPDLEMENEGEMAVVVWSMSADDVEPI